MTEQQPVQLVTDSGFPGMIDKGVPYEDGEPGHIIVRTTGLKRRQLAIHGRVFDHVSEDTNGDWIYRHG